MSCGVSDEELQHWDGVANPIDERCSECNEECIHNLDFEDPEAI